MDCSEGTVQEGREAGEWLAAWLSFNGSMQRLKVRAGSMKRIDGSDGEAS